MCDSLGRLELLHPPSAQPEALDEVHSVSLHVSLLRSKIGACLETVPVSILGPPCRRSNHIAAQRAAHVLALHLGPYVSWLIIIFSLYSTMYAVITV